MTQSGVPQIELEDGCFSLGDPTYELIGVGGVQAPDPSGQRFLLVKVPDMLPNYFGLVPEFRGGNVVELGIKFGGSTALLAELLEPRQMVALELSSAPLPGLGAFIERQGIGDRVRPHFGVDQGDTERVAGIVDATFGSEPLDLVIDDASHLLDLTRRSFELLFPRLRPGGLYVIEDWAGQHQMAAQLAENAAIPGTRAHERLIAHMVAASDAQAVASRISEEGRIPGSRINEELNAQLAIALRDPESPTAVAFLDRFAAHPPDVELITSPAVRQEVIQRVASMKDAPSGARRVPPPPPPPRTTPSTDRPLAAMALELVLAAAGRGDLIGELVIDRYWLAIRRGDGSRGPAGFRLADEFVDPFELVNPSHA